MKKYDIVIIGGGASGLMCANNLAHNFSVAIIDEFALGKKLLVTGNGRCNFTNRKLALDGYNTELVKNFLDEFDQMDTIKYFERLGIPSFADTEGRVYPVSESAKDIQYALTKGLSGIDYIQDKVLMVKKENTFNIYLSKNEIICADRLIMACGNRDLHTILANFNLKIEKTEKVLCGFKILKFNKSLFGLREDAVVRCKIQNFYFEERGQVQFRRDGISGIVIFNLSAKLSERIKYPFNIELELLPDISYDDLISLLKSRRKMCSNLTIKDCLLGILKTELAKYILKECKIEDTERTLAQMKDIELIRVAKKIKSCVLTCSEKYNDCQVLAGGITLSSLNNFESEIKNLYFIGETTKVYGICGGYNLQWAWTSGYCLAKRLNKLANRKEKKC